MRFQKTPINLEKPINNWKSKLGKRANHEKKNLSIVAHDSFGMLTSSTHSSGDLCGSVLRCVVWQRFKQAKDGRGRKQRK